MVGRIPVIDVMPLVDNGRLPAKASVGEPFPVSATVFREGHDAVAADVVVKGPNGKRRPFLRMAPGAPGTDRWHAPLVIPGGIIWAASIWFLSTLDETHSVWLYLATYLNTQ